MKHNEEFWRGQFGDDYNGRNASAKMVESNVVLFGRIVAGMEPIHSALELGCGTGQNLQAIATLDPEIKLQGVEINERASLDAAKITGPDNIHTGSILGFRPAGEQWDLVFTKGVLIHQHPADLAEVYRLMHKASRRYIVVAEYYNPTPMEVEYRRNQGVLWKRDFAGELLDGFSDLRLIDSGFAYHRGPFPQDDLTWFLLEKRP